MPAQAYSLDVAQVRRAFDRAADRQPDPASLQREIERRMAERLDYIRIEPRRVLDAGCGTGDGLALLRRRYPKAELLGVDLSRGMARSAAGPGSLAQHVLRLLGSAARHCLCADFARLPLRPGSVDVVWSNLALAWAIDPLAALREFHRVAATDGLLMFSSYGPDTLKELRAAFATCSRERHVHEFPDMHDLGDMLIQSGFAAPVMDMEMITLTYADADALARDLKSSGQTCASCDRRRSLTGRGTWRRMRRAYETERKNGRLPATVEVIYGHAWKGAPRMAAGGPQVVKWAEKIGP
jgi:malonyl-CoA O-methyltransferase